MFDFKLGPRDMIDLELVLSEVEMKGHRCREGGEPEVLYETAVSDEVSIKSSSRGQTSIFHYRRGTAFFSKEDAVRF